MSKKGHSEEQIVAALQQVEGGEKVADLCRKMSISQATFYTWRKQYAGVGVAELRELRQLRDENGRLKRLVADLSLDRQIRQEIVSKKAVKPRVRRKLAEWAKDAYRISERRATRLVRLDRSSHRYRSRRDPQEALRRRLKEVAATYVRYGYRRLTVLLRREGWQVNAKRVYRIYAEEGLTVRTKQRRKHQGFASPTCSEPLE